MYSVIDIETTGGSPVKDKITEIAVYVHDGKSIVDEYSTLINPEKDIPYYITQLTGITNEMVADAPKFYEVAKDIVELTEGTVFIAHNVGFDYGFVRNEFKNLGFEYKREQLCTVKMSRKLIPGKKSYSLGNLCDDLGIVINDRHRAAGDALATVKLFELLLKYNGKDKPLALYDINTEILKNLNKAVDAELLANLPEETGVYYFYNCNKDVIYVGKSKNIRKRVLSHLRNNSKRAAEMKSLICDITYELTGSELVALLLESDEIKSLKPKYNRAQRRNIASYGIFKEVDSYGYLQLRIDKIKKDNQPITSFTSLAESKRQLFKAIDDYQLCQKLCGLYESEFGCFHHQIGQCLGACMQKEPVEMYNDRVNKLINKWQYEHNNALIIDIGRNINERAVAIIEKGKYLGYGYIDADEQIIDVNQLKEFISGFEDNRDIRQIINLYIRKNKAERVILF